MAHGSAIIMTTEANKTMFHAVPKEKDAEPRVSIVLRSISTVLSDADLNKKVALAQKSKDLRERAKKRRAEGLKE